MVAPKINLFLRMLLMLIVTLKVEAQQLFFADAIVTAGLTN
jgi:hypothetical protein